MYHIKGVGTVLAGRVLSGSLKVGDEIKVVPHTGEVHKVRSLEMFHCSRHVALPGDVVGIVAGFKGAFSRGMVVCSPDSPLKATMCFTATVKILPTAKATIRRGCRPYVFCATNTFAVCVDALIARLDKHGQVEEDAPLAAKKGSTLLVRFVTEQPVCLDVYPSPVGRFLIRDGEETVAVGVIKSLEAQQAKNVQVLAKGAKKKYFK